MAETFRIAIVGSGPGGLSAGARAAQLGISHVLLGRCDHASDTIYKYQKGKFVMATPDVLPLRSDMSFQAGVREDILGTWDQELEKNKVNIRYKAGVKAIQKQDDGRFKLTLDHGEELFAETVVLGIGLQGNLRKLTIPGGDLPHVQYQLDDPDEYESEDILVVGGGDAGIENAVALAKQNRVSICNREAEFARAKQGNLILITKAMEAKQIDGYLGTVPVRVDAKTVTLATPTGEVTIPCDRIIARLGADAPRNFVESCGIVFPSKDFSALPAVSATYESNVPGLYIIGALAGYPLIKQAMNQGYEVVEFINGNDLAPADEPLLADKLKKAGVTEGVQAFVERVQASVPLFSGLTSLQLREFLLDSEIHRKGAGETVFQINDYSSTFFSIVEGRVKVQIDPADASKVVTIPAGEFFGEMGLISGRRRNATVVSDASSVLIETNRRTMIKLINSVPAVRRELDRTFIVRQLAAMFDVSIAGAEFAPLVEKMSIERFRAGDVLFEEGKPGDSMHLIRRGSVTVSRRIGGKDIVLSYVPAGHYVGEMALVSKAPRSATVRAAVMTETIKIDGETFQSLLQAFPKLRQQIEKTYQDRLMASAEMEARPDAGNIIQFLIGQGVGEATDVLLIDESLCVRCDNCEKACAEAHGGTSRLDREAGPTFASIHVPTSCRHCEHPHCMADCPPDAISRLRTGEVFIDHNKCIGCGNCERNCPYGVIHMSAGDPPKKPGLFSWMMFGLGYGPGEDKSLRHLHHDHAPGAPPARKKAVKCDMCKGIEGGAACVRSCPTGAAIRVNPSEFFKIANLART